MPTSDQALIALIIGYDITINTRIDYDELKNFNETILALKY